MRYSFLFMLILAIPCAAGPIENGTITSLDGNGGLEVQTEHFGAVSLIAISDLMGDRPKFPLPEWPHVYKQLKVGDRVIVTWGKNEKTGQYVLTRVRILNRGG